MPSQSPPAFYNIFRFRTFSSCSILVPPKSAGVWFQMNNLIRKQERSRATLRTMSVQSERLRAIFCNCVNPAMPHSKFQSYFRISSQTFGVTGVVYAKMRVNKVGGHNISISYISICAFNLSTCFWCCFMMRSVCASASVPSLVIFSTSFFCRHKGSSVKRPFYSNAQELPAINRQFYL